MRPRPLSLLRRRAASAARGPRAKCESRPLRRLVAAVVVYAFVPASAATAAVPPVDDAFSSATAIHGARGRLETSNVGATKEAGEPAHARSAGGASVWLRWTAPRDGQFAFVTAGSDFDTVLAVYTGRTVDTLVPVVSDDDSGPLGTSELSFRAVAGTVYDVAVDGFRGKVGRVHVAWRPAPLNDNFAEADTIAGPTGRRTVGVGATKEAGEPAGNAAGSDRSVWFGWTASGDGPTGFFVRHGGGTVAVYTGANLTTLEPVVRGRTAIFGAHRGVTYWIAVDGTSAGAILVWRPPPRNDNFADATAISGRRGRIAGSTLVATTERREPRHGSGGRASVWYRWRAPGTGVLRLRTAGSTFDTLLAVYRGRRLATLHRIARNDDASDETFASAVRVRVQRGRVYRIAVDGYKGEAGRVVLRWEFAPRPNA